VFEIRVAHALEPATVGLQREKRTGAPSCRRTVLVLSDHDAVADDAAQQRVANLLEIDDLNLSADGKRDVAREAQVIDGRRYDGEVDVRFVIRLAARDRAEQYREPYCAMFSQGVAKGLDQGSVHRTVYSRSPDHRTVRSAPHGVLVASRDEVDT